MAISVCVSVSVCLFVCLSICLSVCMAISVCVMCVIVFDETEVNEAGYTMNEFIYRDISGTSTNVMVIDTYTHLPSVSENLCFVYQSELVRCVAISERDVLRMTKL